MSQRRMRVWPPSLRPAPLARRRTEAPEYSMDPRADEDVPPPVEDSIVDAAVYVDGRRMPGTPGLSQLRRAVPDRPGAMAWIGLYQPSEAQLLAAADQFGLHDLAVEDAIVAHQRPKLERYGDTLFVVLRAARYLDDAEEVHFGEIHLFAGADFVLTVRRGQAPDLSVVRRRLESTPDLLRLGPEAVLYAVLDAVVDGYAPVVAGLQNDIDEIETQVFNRDPRVSRRIYELSREVIEFRRAARPLLDILGDLEGGSDAYVTSEEVRRYLRDVADHATTVAERVDGFRHLLGSILAVNATLVSQAQNEEMKHLTEASYAQSEEVKKISSWAAILFAPTVVGGIYGMNFDTMPELHWAYGYPLALGLMFAVSATLYAIFKHRGWL